MQATRKSPAEDTEAVVLERSAYISSLWLVGAATRLPEVLTA